MIRAKNRLRTLVVDDEPDARERIREILEEETNAEVVGEVGDGISAVRAIRDLEPDLVFLDVRMPEIDGFDVLAAIEGESLPLVVFVTAFDHYAVKAFEVSAIDYVLKPFDRARLVAAFERARQHVQHEADRPDLEALLRQLANVRPIRRVERVLAKVGTGFELVRVTDVDWIAAAGNYVILHLGSRTAMLRQTLGSLERQLDAAQFRRIHRSTIVNLDRVRRVLPTDSGEYAAVLRDDTRLRISRSYGPEALSDPRS